MRNFVYAKTVTPFEVKAFLASIEAKNEESYKRFKDYLNANKQKIIDAYKEVKHSFLNQKLQHLREHKRYVWAHQNKKCICGADTVYVKDYDFWGCTNFNDKSVQHRNFIKPNEWDLKLLDRPFNVNTSDWLRSVKELSGIERKTNHASLLKFLELNSLEDLSMRFEGVSSWDKVNRLKNANKKAKGFEDEVHQKLVQIHGSSNVYPQQGFKYQLIGSESKYAIVDFLVMDYDRLEIVIYECKLKDSYKNDAQRDLYMDVVYHAMKSKGINMNLKFIYVTKDGGFEIC